jgi:transposase
MKNWNSKENVYTEIKSSSIKERAKKVNELHDKGMSVKDISVKFGLSESRIREYLKK